MTPAAAAHADAERAARASYGRLVALLAWQWRDLASAEDALGEAFAQALARWPAEGVPREPEGWLLTVARRELLQAARHQRVVDHPAVAAVLEGDGFAPPPAPGIPDHRLRLLFVCAHPDLPRDVHAPLMLQAVLGVDARRIADAFLASPSAMAQRLVRAKARIRADALRFEEPEARELPARLAAVLEGIYAAYTIGSNTARAEPAWSAAASDLAGEASFLARLVASLQPASAEALGLLALLLFCESRRAAQFDAQGRFVPLARQDTSLWDRALLREAEQLLWQASALGDPGPLQWEAAIQSAHAQRAATGAVPWPAIVALYEALVRAHAGMGAVVGHAAALGESGQPAAGLAALDGIAGRETASYQPYWVVRAHLLRACGRADAAHGAQQRAIGLTADPRIREWLASSAGADGR